MGTSAAKHWDTVYGTKAATEVSWFQANPSTSLRLLTSSVSSAGAALDVGAGASSLADALLDAGWSDITVLDVSAQALRAARDRLGERGDMVSFVVVDLLSWQPERPYDGWHDRALFHFLVRQVDREQYLATALGAISPGGVMVLGTFAPDGPTECSGLRTARYDADALAAAFAPAFKLLHNEREEHVTPGGAIQPFTWVVLQRV
ncbi:MAG: class I SAM-dependent methyltransferase [Actinomycetota bacterium]